MTNVVGYLARRRTPYAGLLAIALCAISYACRDSTSPPVPQVAALTLLSATPPGVVVASHLDVAVRAVDSSGNGAGGVPVNWTVSNAAGSLSAAHSVTDNSGVAFVQWTVGTKAGIDTLVVTTPGLAPMRIVTRALPGAPAQAQIDDTVRFTAINQIRDSHLIVSDSFGNRLDSLRLIWKFPTPIAAFPTEGPTQSSTGRLRSNLAQVSTGTVALVSQPDVVLARTTVVIKPVIVSLDLYFDPTGLAVGESKPAHVLARDSLSPTSDSVAAAAGIRFTSSNPGIAAIDANGRAVGISPGQVTISAALGTMAASATVHVDPRYDLGVPSFTTPVGDTDLENLYAYYRGTIGDDGSACIARHFRGGHGGTPSSDVLACYDPFGVKRFGIAMLAPRPVAIDPAGTVYVLGQANIAAITRDGTMAWLTDFTPAINGDPKGDAGDPVLGHGQIYFSIGQRIIAMRASGTIEWSRLLSHPIRSISVAGSRIIVATAESVAALDDAGRSLWETTIPRPQVRVDSSSNVFVLSESGVGQPAGELVALNGFGTVRWRTQTSSTDSASWSLGPNESIILYDKARILQAFDRATGATRWTTDSAPSSIDFTPTTAFGTSDGKVLLVAAYVYVYDGSSGTFLGRTAERVSPYRFSPRLLNGALVVGSYPTLIRYNVPFGPAR